MGVVREGTWPLAARAGMRVRERGNSRSVLLLACAAGQPDAGSSSPSSLPRRAREPRCVAAAGYGGVG